MEGREKQRKRFFVLVGAAFRYAERQLGGGDTGEGNAARRFLPEPLQNDARFFVDHVDAYIGVQHEATQGSNSSRT